MFKEAVTQIFKSHYNCDDLIITEGPNFYNVTWNNDQDYLANENIYKK